MILNLQEDDRGGEDEGGTEEGEVADILGLEGELASIEIVDESSTDGLDTLVEADKVGRATTRVGKRTHEPVKNKIVSVDVGEQS